MTTLTLTIEYSKNEGLVLSPSDLQNLYLSGIPICFPATGGRISQETIKQKIAAAQKYIENVLSIKLQKQLIIEEQDFNRQEFHQWGYIRTVYPIVVPKLLEGRINDIIQITYPENWLSIKNGNDPVNFRNMHIIPNTKGPAEQNAYSVVYSGLSPALGYFGAGYIPNYWKANYGTGWEADEIPIDIIDAIGKHAAIQMLAIIGDLLYGPGIGNQSVSLDGISQTYSTTKSGGKGAFSGRVDQYKSELEQSVKDLKAEYLGIMFRVV